MFSSSEKRVLCFMLLVSMALREATRGCVSGMDPEMRLRGSLRPRYACGGCLYHIYMVLSSLTLLYISF